ncbi:MAG: PPC domain-containing protein [Planctomycetes bacterium]|nr:PPC domain-containing protein [Planctomycetota bacterium]
MRTSVQLLAMLLCGAAVFACGDRGAAEVNNHQAVLQSVFPAGGGRGTKVEVTFTGAEGGLEGADGLLIDGPPGVAVERFESQSASQAQATLVIAEDAAPGRRMIRVKGGTTGLTNFRWFFVGDLDEHVESTKNNELDQAETVQTPVVVNGRVEATLDQDCFRFQARKGESLVLAVQSHWLDAMGYDRDTAGFADASLELLDESGRIVAEAGDTLGYDPLIHYAVPSDGWYTARVSGMGYKGFPQFVYRLTIGEVPYPVAVFPPGGRRGQSVEVTFRGPNIPGGTSRVVVVTDDPSPVQYVSLDGSAPDLPFVRSDHEELTPDDPGDALADATPLDGKSLVVNGCFETPGDEDWFRVDLAKGEKIALDVLAQRHLRSPVDTRLEVYDADGKLLAANDDSELILSEVNHEFVPFDSQLSFEAKQPGEHYLRIIEQSGAGGPRAVYRLTRTADEPGFKLYQWPDAVPVWGPGTTAAFVVEIHRSGGLKEDVAIVVEGLPEGWRGSAATAAAADYRHAVRGAFGHKVFLTITAPANAAVGEVAEFRVVGRAKTDDGELVRTAQPLTHFSWGEPNRFRAGVTSRAVVARPQGVALEAGVESVAVRAGEAMEIPLSIASTEKTGELAVSLSVNRAGTHFKCSLGPPVKVTFHNGAGALRFPLPAAFEAGRSYDLLVADAWSGETRKGLPGPCTRLIRVNLLDK